MASVKVRITSATKELVFDFSGKKTSGELFLDVCKSLAIHETWYFGLNFKTDAGDVIWLDASKKKMEKYRPYATKLNFTIKYHPEDVVLDLIENETIKYFFLHVRAAILADLIFCPPDTCFLLASYAAQVKYGDYDPDYDISKDTLLPERIYKQFNMEKVEFLKQIVEMWKKHNGLFKDDAMVEYLKTAQNLEMFGVHYFNITNNKGSKVLLGIHPLGLNIYKPNDKINPVILFPWSEIGNLNFRGKKFSIKMSDKTANDFIFLSEDQKINKRILNLGIGYHQIYIRRRKPDTLDIHQMREQASSQRNALISQREKLRAEIETREMIEKRYKQEVENLRREMEIAQNQLKISQETIQKLNRQLEEIEAAKRVMEARQIDLEEMMAKLRESNDLEAAEREKLAEEIRERQAELQRLREEAEAKEAESKRMQDEIEEARRRQDELEAQQREEQARREAEQAEMERLALAAHSELPKLNEVNQQLNQQLAELQNKLEDTRNVEMDTEEDKIYRDNLREGRDKYKTLSDIRKGNTTRRVELFESI